MDSPSAGGRLAFLRRPIVVLGLGLLALLASGVALLLHQHVRGRYPLALDRSAIEPAAARLERGLCWYTVLDPEASEHLQAARVRLFENGKELGPAGALHETIRQEGGGGFSVWNGGLYFSSSDGSEPTTNGRHYELVWPVHVPRSLVLGTRLLAALLGLLTAIAAARLWTSRAQPWLHSRLGTHIGRANAAITNQGAKGHWRACLFVVLVAVSVRIVAIALIYADPANHISGASIVGVPFSDAQGWDALGESVMAGHGLAGGWSARRPFLALVIGSLYLWTGPLPIAVIALNVLLSGWTAALVCRIGQRVCHPLVGLVAGLAFAFDTISVEYTEYLMTETLGTFLFVLSTRYMIAGMQENRASSCWWSGVAFTLSNLTRTLTLPAAPAFALAALLGGRTRAGTWQRGLALAMVFCLGAGLPLGAWIARQKIVHDLPTISDNTASGLYGAASPKYGAWTGAIDREADEAGIPGDIKSRYDWFMRRFREELSANPSFYRDNVIRSVGANIDCLARMPPTLPWLLLAMLTAVWLSRLPVLSARVRTLLPWLLVSAGAGYAVFGLSPLGTGLLAALGTLTAIGRQRLALLLLAAFACTIVSIALFALGGDPRLLFMVSWMMPMMVANGVLALVALAARGLGDTAWLSWLTATTEADYRPRWQTFAVRGLVGTLMLSMLAVGYRNFVSPMPELAPLRHPSLAEAETLVQRVAQLRPAWIAEIETVDPQTWYQQTSGPDATPGHGRIVVACVRLDRHRYPLVQDMNPVGHYSRMFVKRPYERLHCYATCCLLPKTGWGPRALIMASPMPSMAVRDVVVVGRANVDRNYIYEENYLEVLAWAPLGPNGHFDLGELQVTAAPAHAQLVRNLRP